MNSSLSILLILLSFILYYHIVKYTDDNNIDFELNKCKNIWKLFVLNPIEMLFKDTKYSNDIKFILMVFGTQIIHFIYFWFHCIILNIIDLYPNNFPNVRKYKIQPNKNDPIDMNKYWICIKQALFNQSFVNISFAIITYPLFIYQGCSISIDNFPTLRKILLDFFIFIVIEEIGFYYCHRIMHSPLLYTKIHKQHHEWTSPISCAAIYANPIEHALCNLLPLVTGPILCGSHLFTYWLWLTIAVFMTINSHCGYHFPFFPSPEFHDYHHLKFNTNYGVIGILDSIHGTDDIFIGSEQDKRNVVFTNFSDENIVKKEDKLK